MYVNLYIYIYVYIYVYIYMYIYICIYIYNPLNYKNYLIRGLTLPGCIFGLREKRLTTRMIVA